MALDILGLGLIGVDVIIFLEMLASGGAAGLVIISLILIRVVRLLRLSTFWFKVAAFHKVRAEAYLLMKGGGGMMMYDPDQMQIYL